MKTIKSKVMMEDSLNIVHSVNTHDDTPTAPGPVNTKNMKRPPVRNESKHEMPNTPPTKRRKLAAAEKKSTIVEKKASIRTMKLEAERLKLPPLTEKEEDIIMSVEQECTTLPRAEAMHATSLERLVRPVNSKVGEHITCLFTAVGDYMARKKVFSSRMNADSELHESVGRLVTDRLPILASPNISLAFRTVAHLIAALAELKEQSSVKTSTITTEVSLAELPCEVSLYTPGDIPMAPALLPSTPLIKQQEPIVVESLFNKT